MEQAIHFRRIRVRIHRAGYLYIGVTLMIGAAAVNTLNNLLYLITAALLALMTVSGAIAYVGLRKLKLSLSLPNEWFAEQESHVRLTIRNTRRLLPSFMIKVTREASSTLLLEIPAGCEASGELPFRFNKRGPASLGEVMMTTEFPFGFFERGGMIPLEQTILVYPAPLPDGEPRAAAGTSEAGAGGAARPGFGGDFRGDRAYQPGDPLNRVDWKATARLGEMQVKEFEEDTFRPLLLTLDSVSGPDVETRLQQLAWLVLRAQSQARPVGLELPEATIGPGVGRTHSEQLLRALALHPV